MDLSQLLPFKFVVDDRIPIAISAVPWDDRLYALYIPSILFWVEILVPIGLIGIVSGLLSIITYNYIVQKQGSSSSYMIGFGILIPLWSTFPFQLIKILDIRNKIIKFGVAAVIPVLGIFKTTEAMFGCAPPHTTTSAKSYFLYCASPMKLCYDENQQSHLKCTMRDTMLRLGSFLIKLTLLGGFQSFATPSGMHPFGSPTGEWYDPTRLWNPRQYLDNLVYAFLFQMYLSAYCEGLIAATMFVTGLHCEAIMENPLMQSQSLTELWSKKWNKLVEGVLKRGVYLPLRKSGYSKNLAALSTFLASGLFHEWLLVVLFVPMKHEISSEGLCHIPLCYHAPLGGQIAFMLWNALAIVFENIVCHLNVVQQMARILPSPIRTFFVIAPGVLVAHWFVEPYVMSNFFAHGQHGLFMLLPIEGTVD